MSSSSSPSLSAGSAATMLTATIFLLSLSATLSISMHGAAEGSLLYQQLDVTWGDGRGKFLDNGQLLTLSLDKFSGSGFQSKNQYLFGKIDMQIKLVPDNSAGTVTTFYLSSQGPNHDELDFEFLGNLSGDPYTIHTNVFAQGKGDREQQFHLWFDPTNDFHTYCILWNPLNVIFSIDGVPLRVFKNHEGNGVPYPNKQEMRVYSSLWDAENWATRGGLIKTDWSKAPFTASYRSFDEQTANQDAPWWSQGLDSVSLDRLKWVQKNWMIYNYCTDWKRFPQGVPAECSMS